MAITERKYQRATHDQLLKCLKWGLNHLNLRNWEVAFLTKELPNGSLGECNSGNGYTMKATIAIDLIKHRKENHNPYSTVLHEVMHLLTEGVCQIDNSQSEPISYRIEDSLYQLYCHQNKIKIAEKRE